MTILKNVNIGITFLYRTVKTFLRGAANLFLVASYIFLNVKSYITIDYRQLILDKVLVSLQNTYRFSVLGGFVVEIEKLGLSIHFC